MIQSVIDINFGMHLPISQFVPVQLLTQSHLRNVPSVFDTQDPPFMQGFGLLQPGPVINMNKIEISK